MKKFLVLILMSMLMTSCTLFNKDANSNDTSNNGQTEVSVKSGDFQSLYGAYVTAQMNEAKSIVDFKNSKAWKEVWGPKKSNGDLKLSIGAGQFGSIDAIAKIAAHASGFDSKVTFSDVSVDVKDANGMTTGDVAMKAKELTIAQTLLQKFVKYQELDLPKQLASQAEKIKEYEGKWLEFPSGITQEQMRMAQRLLTIDEKYIKELVVKYPILKAKGEAKIEGTKNTFEVELNADNMIAITKEIAKKVGKEDEFADSDDEVEMREGVKEINELTTMMLTFDEKNHLFLEGKIVAKKEDEYKADVKFNTNKNLAHLDITAVDIDSPNSKDNATFVFDFKKEKEVYIIDLSATEGGQEIVKWNIQFVTKDQILSMLKLNIENPEDKVKVVGEYENKDNKFKGIGKVNEEGEVIATFNFDGSTKDKTLETFNFNADFPEEKSNIKTTYESKNGDFKGKAEVKADGSKIFDASLEGTLKDQTVQTLKMNANLTGLVKITVDTKDIKDGIMQGKIALESANPMASGKITADLGLGLGKEIFALQLKNIQIDSEQMPPQAKAVTKDFSFDLVIHGKEQKTDEKVEMPKEYISAEEVSKKFGLPVYEDYNDEDYGDEDVMMSNEDLENMEEQLKQADMSDADKEELMKAIKSMQAAQ